MEIPARINTLKKSHLFRGLNDGQLKSLAESVEEVSFGENTTLFVEGQVGDAFYFIQKGQVEITHTVKKDEVRLATLVGGDYFGEEALISKSTRNANAKVKAGTLLFRLNRDGFYRLIKQATDLRPMFKMVMHSREVARHAKFKWLAANETVYFAARRHPVFLYQKLAIPVLLGIVPIVLIVLAFMWNSATMSTIAVLFAAVIGLWGLWRYIDWENDYYIITNQRIAYIEKIVFSYDSRTEALLSTVLSVGQETDYWGRQFGYGSIVIRTYTNTMKFTNVQYHQQVVPLLDEYWGRVKESTFKSGDQLMHETLKRKISPPAPKPAAPPPPPAKPSKPKKPPITQVLFPHLFELRYEEGGVINYRKHWLTLVSHMGMDVVVFVLALAVWIGWEVLFPTSLPLFAVVIIGLVFLVLFGRLVYLYLDWSNDMYRVTQDQIMDVDRTPLGDENKRTAPIENIQTMEYQRNGLVGNLFNFGTVFINVGNDHFDFVDVADPPSVQQDIMRRLNERMIKKREAEGQADRDKIADWLAAYHRVAKELEAEERKRNNPE